VPLSVVTVILRPAQDDGTANPTDTARTFPTPSHRPGNNLTQSLRQFFLSSPKSPNLNKIRQINLPKGSTQPAIAKLREQEGPGQEPGPFFV
jgi:hypothetical protein